ncbi:MAG: hypothetical protein EA404_08305 [Spirochaetaceae bacterium]|nr:MAG: hypothetical protein EA404_08305 [Spirochaetaceae bacterium]
MRQSKPKRISGVLLLVLLAVYLLGFPRGTGQELQLLPQWVSDVSPAAPAGNNAQGAGRQQSGSARAFRLGDRFGYLDRDGTLLLSEAVLYDVTLTDNRFANYSEVSQTVVIQDPAGSIIGTIDAEGYPLFLGELSVLLHPDGVTVSQWRSDGARLWRYSVPAAFSAIDAAADVTLIGAIDGRLIALDQSGGELLQYRSRSGRLPVVAAAALSSDAALAAAVLDIDPQRVALFERSETGYELSTELELPDSLRRPLLLQFAFSDRTLLWEQRDGLGGLRIGSRRRFELPLDGAVSGFADIPEMQLLAVITRDEDAMLLLQPPYSRPIIRLPLPHGDTFVRVDGRNLLLGVQDRVASYRLERG